MSLTFERVCGGGGGGGDEDEDDDEDDLERLPGELEWHLEMCVRVAGEFACAFV